MLDMRLLSTLLLLGTPALAQHVSYEKFQLDNGLTVILHEDHSLPQVVVNTWYYVGAKDEAPGRSGFAHLFEHLMFRGTERVPGSSFDDWMEAGGGSNNASTGQDYTNYYDEGPAELLPLLLWLEADRMQALGPNVTQEKLDAEREVVRNELRQSYEGVPYESAYLASFPLLYPEGHPYHDPVIGSHAELEAATLDDVREFFAEYYVPNNASLVVAGDFDPIAVRESITRLFGAIPRRSDPTHREAPPVVFERDRTVSLVDPEAPFAQTRFLWHSPPFLTQADAELDLAATLLAGGVSSRLYQELVVRRGLAEDVEAHQESRRLGSSFTVTALAREGVDLDELEGAIQEVIDAFVEEGPSREELARAQARVEASNLRGLDSIQAVADQLNLYQAYFGEPDWFANDLQRYRSATPESLRRTLAEVVGRPRRIQRVLPAAPPPAEDPLAERPQPLPPKAFHPPAPIEFKLANGIEVQFWQRDSLPLVQLILQLPVGSGQDPQGKAGMMDLAGTLMTRGAGARTAAEFADALDRLGGELEVDVQRDVTRVHLAALSRELSQSLDLMADAVLHPRFDAAEWERVKRERLADLTLSEQDPMVIARRIALRAFFGPEHPYGRLIRGTTEEAQTIELNELVAFYSDILRPEGARLLVAGDVEREALEAELNRVFGQWQGLLSPSGRHERPAIDPPAIDGMHVLVFDRPGATQTVVRFQLPTVLENDPERPLHDLVVTLFGGSFTSRLNVNLRVERGITYGAQAAGVRARGGAYLIAQARIQAGHTGEGVAAFLEEFARLREGDVTEDEARKAIAHARLGVIQDFAGLDGLVTTGAELARFGRGVEDLADELERQSGLTAEDLRAVSPKVGDLSRAVLVLVGDAKRILADLKQLDLPAPVLVDGSGRPSGD